MFHKLIEPQESLTFTFDGKPLAAAPGDSVAAALLAAGVVAFRHSAVGGEPRAPYCLMGICFDCLVTIDGIANQQSCQVDVAQGMTVQSQHGLRVVDGRVSE
ncbi:MAG: (2Fe-2S)-binding protein [Holophaga sp.]|nr:(2Fe-2S)-binding protein [Holophaga sp.]